MKTDKSVRQDRYKERGSEQNETWLAGRETKVSNIMTNFALMFITKTFSNNTLEEQDVVFDYIKNIVNSGGHYER